MLKRFIIAPICILVLLISGSDNASSYQLLSFANTLNNSQSHPLLYKSARLGNQEAANTLLVLAETDKDKYWLTQIALLPFTQYLLDIEENAQTTSDVKTEHLISHGAFKTIKSQAAYALAVHSNNERDKTRWFSFASNLNHPQSQFELSLLLNNRQERLRLLKNSAREGYVPAVITLAKYYHQHAASVPAADQDLDVLVNIREENRTLALYWLEKSSQYDGASAFDLGLLYWQIGQVEEAKSSFIRAAMLGVDKAQDYLEVLSNQAQSKLTDIFAANDAPMRQLRKTWCSQQLQVVASSLETVVRANQIKRQFEQDERFEGLSICMNPVVWLPKNVLACKNQAINARINCDLKAFAEVLRPPNFTHLVVITDAGKAYVQRGVMYLDRADEYSVFVHELAHFAGFVDEYALSKQMASLHCGSPTAPNLMVESEGGELNNVKMLKWQDASTEALSIAPSKTCQRYDKAAYKPSTGITFLEHHDTENIPKLYLSLWQQQLGKESERIEAANELLHVARNANHAEAITHWQYVLSY
ncbi:hypothetical protein [Glaciecola sp. SC05]|uniref:hypothetical protein n=1 Tax=Glaciecola sp. SC05 TaxID=1987355 RepID=UPI003528BBC5